MSSSKYYSYDPINKIWSGRKHVPVYNTEANLGNLILQKLIESPQNVFQISDNSGVTLTNLEVYTRIIKFVSFLTDSGLKQGDVVGLIGVNSENLTSIMFACYALGIAVNPLAIIMDVSDICYMWSKTRPKAIFSDANVIGTVKNAVNKMELDTKIVTLMENVDGYLHVDEILKMNVDVENFEYPDLPNIASTSALIICSSGTTNAPKGICKSHKQLLTQVFPNFEANFKTQDVYLINMWSYWISFAWFSIVSALYNCKIIISTNNFTPELWMDVIDRYKVTISYCPPRFGLALLKSKSLRPLPSMRVAIIAGSVFSEKLVENLKPIFPNGTVRCGYGCSESDTISATGKEGPKGASSGYPFKNVKIKIIDDEGNSLGPNEIGEMCYQTPVPFSAYFGDPESYAQAFDSSKFCKSGDLGYVDAEGHFFILDRIKHMIKSENGIKVVPMEVEDIINEIDGVLQSCVVGVFDNKILGDVIYAFIIKDKSRDDINEEYVKNFVSERVVLAKRISGGVLFVDKFPMTPSGKVLNRELKKIATEFHHEKNGVENN